MKLSIEINMDNAAFEETEPANEVNRILNDLVQSIEEAGFIDDMNGKVLRDYNGNKVGVVTVL